MSTPSADGTTSTPAPSDPVNTAIKVDEGLLTVDITMPASFFEDETEDEIKANAKDKGFLSCTVHEDGSVTYKMTKIKQKEMLDEYEKTLETETFAGMLNGENKVNSFIDIQHNKDFSEITVLVDPDQYSMWDNFYMILFYISGSYYQRYAGAADEDIDVSVKYINNNTREVINEGSYKEYMKNINSGGSEDPNSESQDPTPAGPMVTSIEEKETIEVPDICEFYIDYTGITTDVRPPKPGGWYSHYEADDGKVYVDICVAYKNLDTKEVSADDALSATMTYGGTYNYTGFSMIEKDSRSDFTYSNITNISPLSTEYLHYLFEVPMEIKDGEGSIKVIIHIAGNQYELIAREGIEGEVSKPNEAAVAKTGVVKDGEVIAVIKNCEFYVDYVDITDDVLPPNPGNWYSHYAADSGKVYVDLCIAYKNWKSNKVGADDVMSATLTYAGKYEYKGFSMIEEDSRGDFTYSNITNIAPLATEYLHYLFSVPEEIKDSTDSIDISFTIGGNNYSYKVR